MQNHERGYLNSGLPQGVARALKRMPGSLRREFFVEFRQRRRGVLPTLILAVIFPVQLFLLGRWLLGAAFWATLGGLGVWWVVEIFLTPGRVRDYNMYLARSILDNIIGVVI
ncbi:MAG: hypothetical protein KQH53_12060 [Desulfarculaceae bacterium]|nr:hypothetical protein [Desulfarculaceae bacterium]